jgi:uncharacterized repeat protein (TIGR01451 family)
MMRHITLTRRQPLLQMLLQARLQSLLLFILLITCLLPQTASAALTMTRVSSSVFYADFTSKTLLSSMYAAYQVTSSTAETDVWAGIGSFSGDSVSLAQNEDGVVHLGAFTAGQTKTAFFYLTASTISSTAQGHVVTLYGARAPFATVLAAQAFSLSSVIDTIKAGANKVDTVVSGPNPPSLGGLVTVTVSGHTGTIDSNIALGAGVAFTPASYADWPANKLELVTTRLDFSGGNSGSYSDLLVFGSNQLPSPKDTDYVATYTFRATGTTSRPTSVSPTGYIISGANNLKHTDEGAFTGLAPIQPISNFVSLSLLALPATLPSTGGVASYTVRIVNAGSNFANLDDIINLLPTTPAPTVYVPGSARFNGVALPDPIISGLMLTWSSTFTIAAGAARDLTFQATLPATAGTYTDSVTGLAGNAVIDTTLGASDYAPATASTRVLQAPVISTAFTPSAIASGGAPGSVSFSINNPNALDALAGVAFTDALPVGSASGQMLVATAPGATTTNCGTPTFAPLAGSSSLAFSGATIAAGATCTVTVQIIAGTAGTYANSTSTVSATNGGTGNSAAALLTVTTKPTLSKSFAPATIASGTNTTLTLVLSNTTATALSNVAFTDNFPTGLTVASTPALSNSCGGTLTNNTGGVLAAGATSISLASASLAANGSCTLTVAVTASSASASSYTNTSAGVSSAETGSAGPASNSAILSVLSAPSMTKTFAPAVSAINTPVGLTFSISNPNAVAINGVAFSDALPGAMVVASTPGAVTSGCGAPTFAPQAGAATLAFSGASIAAGAICKVSVQVTVPSTGSYNNVSAAVTSLDAGSGNSASATLVANTTPTIAIAWSPATIATGATSTLTFTLRNTSAAAISGVAFTDNLPSGLGVAATPGVTTAGCGTPVFGPAANDSALTFSGGSIAANAVCTVTLSVTATASGSYNNQTSGVTSTQSGTPGNASNIATLVALNPPAITASFTPDPSAVNLATLLTFVLANTNAQAISGVGFSDLFPVTPGTMTLFDAQTSNSCGGALTNNSGAVLATGAVGVQLAGASIAANSSCTITFNVKISAVGAYSNTTSAVSHVVNAATLNGNTASATVTMGTLPTIAKRFAPANIAAGASSTLTIVVSNNSAAAISSVALSDPFPYGMVVAANPAPTFSPFCGAPVFAPVAGASAITLSGATIAAGASCTVSVAVTAASAGSYGNVTSGATSSINATAASPSNTATLTVLANLTISTAFNPSTITTYGAPSALTFVITNPNPVAVSSVSFGDSFPANLVVAATPALSGNCGGTVTATAGASSYALSGGTLAAGASCTLTVNVTSELAASYVNASSGVSSGGGSPGLPSNSATLMVTAPDLRLAKSHAGTFTVAAQGIYTLSASNAGSAVSSGLITVVDTLPAGLTFVSASGTGWSCGAVGQSVTCTTSATIAAASTLVNGITLTVAVGSSAVPGVTNMASISGGGEPASYAGNNSAVDQTSVAALGKNSFAPDGMQTTLPGSTVFYLHQFNAGQSGTLVFGASSAPDPVITGWNFVMYRDADCSASLSAGEVTTPLSSAIAVAAGDQVCIIIKEFAPASAPYNARDVITVSATLTPTSGLASTQTRSDTTLIGSAGGAGLVLQKTVLNVTASGTAGIANVAKSGEMLEYTITYINKSSAALASITINDAPPAYTRFASAACNLPLPMSISSCSVPIQPVVNGSGPIEWRLGGTLSSAASGSVTFRVTVD